MANALDIIHMIWEFSYDAYHMAHMAHNEVNITYFHYVDLN